MPKCDYCPFYKLMIDRDLRYVKMLEQQQGRLIFGLQEMYRRAINGRGWLGAPLAEASNGSPLTHSILERLGALEHGSRSNPRSPEPFEEDVHILGKKFLDNGQRLMQPQDDWIIPDLDNVQMPVLDFGAAYPTLCTDTFANDQFQPPSSNHTLGPQRASTGVSAHSQSIPMVDIARQDIHLAPSLRQLEAHLGLEYDQSIQSLEDICLA